MPPRTLTGILVFAGFKGGMGEFPSISFRGGDPEVQFVLRDGDGKETPFQMPISIKQEAIESFSRSVVGRTVEYQDSFEKGRVSKRLTVTDNSPIEYSSTYRMY